jgi:hypothetical protein
MWAKRMKYNMGDNDEESSTPMSIHDSIVMGDINIYASDSGEIDSSTHVRLNFPTGQNLLRFVQENWLDLLAKHTSEKISLQDHGTVLMTIHDHLFRENVDDNMKLKYREIIRQTLLDNRSLSSSLIQAELGLMKAITFLFVDDFEEFTSLIDELSNVIKNISDSESLGLFADYTEYYLARQEGAEWWSVKQRGEELSHEDIFSEIIADAVLTIVREQNFMAQHGDWLVNHLLDNHNSPRPGYLNVRSLFTAKYNPWSKVRLDRVADDLNGEVMFSRVLKATSMTLRQMENILRILFSPEFGRYPPSVTHLSDDYSMDRFYIVTKSLQQGNRNCARLLRAVASRGDEKKKNEFWAWLDLVTFAATFHADDLFSYDTMSGQYSLSREHIERKANEMGWSKDDVEDLAHDQVLPAVEKLFSDLEAVNYSVGRGVINSRMRMKGREKQALGIINSINATYFPCFPGSIQWKLEMDFIANWFAPDPSFKTKKDSNGTRFIQKVDMGNMPVYWSGSETVSKHPRFDDFFTKWQAGEYLFFNF